MKQKKMLKIFKRNRKKTIKEPQELSLEEKITGILNKIYKNEVNDQTSVDTGYLKERLNDNGIWNVFRLCGNSDAFPISVLMSGEIASNDQICHLLNETSTLEVLPEKLDKSNLDSFIWRVSRCTILTDSQAKYFIISEEEKGEKGTLMISRSREFLFGEYLIPPFAIGTNQFLPHFNKITFTLGTFEEKGYKGCYSIDFSLRNREINCICAFRERTPSIDHIANQLVREQKKSLEQLFETPIEIRRAGPIKEEVKELSGYDLEAKIHSAGKALPVLFRFPKKLLNLLPDRDSSTVKGKILQTNLHLFSIAYSRFHLTGEDFFLDDYLTLVDSRDLNLICQNFFVSSGMSGSVLRELFFYKKQRLTAIPFRSRDRLMAHLPLQLKEGFQTGKTYSRSYDELKDKNIRLLGDLYEQWERGKLLLSENACIILKRETGAKVKENRMLRLKKLLADHRYIAAINKMENSRIQIFLGSLKHRVVTDLFVYQTEKLPWIKNYLSRNRFAELSEDIRFTQKKIKNGQIDINRICDSIEEFNRAVKTFVKKEKQEPSPAGKSSSQ